MFRFSVSTIPSAALSTQIILPRLSSLAALFLGLTGILFSQDVEIVVSASRIKEEAQNSSSYVRVIPSEVVDRAEWVLGALKSLPDIVIKTNAPGRASISMGGFGENGFARTLVLLNGRPINRADMASVNWQTIPLDGIQRIEVLRGPLSSQYGDQAIAGAINIITRRPEGFEAWIRASLSTSFSSREALGIAWGGEKFFVRGGLHYINLTPIRERSDADIVSASLNLDAELRSLILGLRGFFAESSYQIPGGLSESEYRNNPNKANNKEDQVSETTWMIEFDLETSIGPLTVIFPVSWRRVSSEADATADTWSSFADSSLDDVRGSIQGNIELYPNDRITLIPIGGVDVNWSGITVTAYNERARRNRSSRESARRLDFALWLRLKAVFGERWAADAGMRLATYRVSGGSERVRYMPLVYDFGGAWTPREDWTVRLRYGRVFRYPALDEQVSYYFSPSSINTDLAPEFGHHIIASLEYNKDEYRADMGAYFIAMNDEIAFNATSLKNANIGSTQHMGLLISLSRAGSILGLSGSYALDFAQNSGRRIPLVPLHSIYGRVSLTPIESLEFSTDAKFTSNYYKGGDVENRKGTVRGRLGWDLRMDWRPIDDLDIYARVTNLLDDRMPTEVYWHSYSDRESWYPTEGREFSLGAIWRN